MSATAETVEVPGVGTLTVDGTGPDDGYIEANGDDTNECPLAGYLAADSDGLHGSDEAGSGYARGEDQLLPPADDAGEPTAPCS